MATSTEKLLRLLACPACRAPLTAPETQPLRCAACGAEFGEVDGVPRLLSPTSPVLQWFSAAVQRPDPSTLSLKARVRMRLESHRPQERIWTRRSQQAIARLLTESRPDEADRTAVLIGSGREPVYQRLLAPYSSIVRVGLAHDGGVDAYCDLCELPFRDASVDLIFSSSVLEHVHNIERACAEMARVIRPGGMIYAEIPFLRAFHMIPVDYQRYTIAGIEALFGRHGFLLQEKGVCSGRFTAQALYLRDFWVGFTQRLRKLQAFVDYGLSWALHPMKYLDRWCEDAPWAEITACNFYFWGRKPPV
jgi:SAM-dependent methyltransferase